MDSGIQIGQEIIAKFNIKNQPLYAKILWKEDDEDLFHITVFYLENTWTGKYSNELAAKRRERLDETKEEYNKNVKQCLSGSFEDYVYDFTSSPDDTNSASFVWKKQYEGALKTQGVVPLQRDENPTSINTLLDTLLVKNISLVSEVNLAKKTIDDLKEDLDQYIQKLEEMTQDKLLLESTLYGRFVQVLNEKKKRIQLLEDNNKNLKTP